VGDRGVRPGGGGGDFAFKVIGSVKDVLGFKAVILESFWWGRDGTKFLLHMFLGIETGLNER